MASLFTALRLRSRPFTALSIFPALSAPVSIPSLPSRSVLFPSPSGSHLLLQQHRSFVQNLRPRRQAYKKSHKGFFPVRTGGSLRGTVVRYGEYGLQAMRGVRLEDKQLDAARTAIKRCLRSEKNSKLYLRVFTDRPVTAKGAEARMGKGKGAVEFYATWVAKGHVLFEVKGVRKEAAEEAMRVAAAALPVKTRFVSATEDKIAPRCLPHFVRKVMERQKFQQQQQDSKMKQ
ncbi:ribosomal protein L16p/L10e-domain-containing protein [Cladochytrium replicatum]|nr:ribosomal protein L16p/L10e-domain-containing protein [Cladochytrium replicatum]